MKKRKLQSDSSECKGGGCDAFANVIDDGASVLGLAYSYDALSRPVTRNADTIACNNRSEVVSSRRGAENAEAYSYDEIGNLLCASFNFSTNVYAANNLNQYSSISTLCASAPPRETIPTHDADGNLVSFDPWSYAYDSGSRLTVVASNGVAVVANAYDHRGRRVRKTTGDATHTFVYDDWNLVLEHVARTDGTTNRIEYVWGKDLSGTLQGAGGVGGLLYVKIDGAIHVPLYDAYGNIVQYRAADGSLSAAYTYDAFGRTMSQNGSLAAVFRHRFSTKCFDVETGLYYYGYRFYSPVLRRWLTRDPKEEMGGRNLYLFCMNRSLCLVDTLGLMPANQWNSVYPESGRFSDALDDFLNGGEPKRYYFHYPDSATTRLLNHPEVNKIWQLFKSADCVNGNTDYSISDSFSTHGNFMNFLSDMYTFFGTLNADRTLNLANLDARDIGYQVLGRFNVSYTISLDCSRCVKQLGMTITDAFTVTSLLRNPISMDPTITYPFLNNVKMTFRYDVAEKVR